MCRQLVDAGAYVIPVLTADAARFVAPLTFSALASEPVRQSLWDAPEPIPHTRLGQQADLIVVCPATAHLIGAYAAGLSGDLLTATLLATRAPVVICPAMHTEMWEHPAVVENVAVLRRRGVHLVGPGVGRLAGGDLGTGRLAEVDEIVASVAAVAGVRPGPTAGSGASAVGGDLAGLRVLATAGGTREPIDPVRYVGNRSSGRQGYAVAEEAAARGATVTLVSTVEREAPTGVAVTLVETAAEMLAAVLDAAASADVVVMAAAVADFRPKVVADRKLKKRDGPPEVTLEPTADILAELAERRRPGQTLVGFAAETGGGRALVEAAEGKRTAKGVDFVVANDVAAEGAGFAHPTNAVVIVGPGDLRRQIALTDKRAVAAAIFDEVLAYRRGVPGEGLSSGHTSGGFSSPRPVS